MLSSVLNGCGSRPLPDTSIPHPLVEEITATIWVRLPDGKFGPAVVRIPAGWYIGPPSTVIPGAKP